MDDHNIAVNKIAEQIKDPTTITNHSESTIATQTAEPPAEPPARQKQPSISGRLKNVLSVQANTKIALVEPNVPMDALTA